MTEQELKALAGLEYNLTRLSELTARQSRLLLQQAQELEHLREECRQQREEVIRWQERCQMVEIAQGLAGEVHQREETLRYLDDVIEEVKLCLKQLEQE